MIKSLRFLGKFYGQIALTILAFGAVVLAGLFLIRDMDNLFGTYYKMFPMLGVVIVAITMFSMTPYCNLALSMNAGRPGLFGAMQLGLAALSLMVSAVSKLLWELGRTLTGGAFSLGLPQLALLAAASLMLGEISILATTLEGKLSRVVYVAAFVLYIVVCGILGAVTALMEEEAGGTGLFAALFSPQAIGIMLAVSLAVAAALAVLNRKRMKKAVVRV